MWAVTDTGCRSSPTYACSRTADVSSHPLPPPINSIPAGEAMPTKDVVLEIRRASRPHGATTLEKLGLTDRQRQHACNTGLPERVYPRVYPDPGSADTPERRLAAAVFAGGPMTAAWGPSSTALWYLTDEHPDSPHIVVPREQRS